MEARSHGELGCVVGCKPKRKELNVRKRKQKREKKTEHLKNYSSVSKPKPKPIFIFTLQVPWRIRWLHGFTFKLTLGKCSISIVNRRQRWRRRRWNWSDMCSSVAGVCASLTWQSINCMNDTNKTQISQWLITTVTIFQFNKTRALHDRSLVQNESKSK